MASSADVPIPSIERPEDRHSRSGSPGSSDASSPSDRILTPASTAESQNDRHARRQRSDTVDTDLTRGLDGIQISSSSAARGGSRTSLTPGPRQRSRRSRSGSHANVIPPHDINDEVPPDVEFERPEIQGALNDSKRLMRDLADSLGESEMSMDHSSTVYRLRQEAQRLANYRSPASRTVGFVGDSGAGKSSLLNSLLDIPDLARTGSAGAACTCVATEYHYHNESTFAIKVHLLTPDELCDHIQPLLASYRHFHAHQDEMDSEERELFEKKSKIAWDTFLAMFRGRIRNNTFLTSGDEDQILSTMMAWVEELMPRHVEEMRSGLNVEECSAILSDVCSETASRHTPAVWPYVEKICVYSNAHILRTGLILVDLPGLRDLNTARRLITENYMLKCHEIFAVCRISRAVTDQGLFEVFELASNARLNNIGIVCTYSEDIRADEFVREPKWQGQPANTARSIMTAIAAADSADREIAEALRELLDIDDDDDLFPDDRLELSRLIRRREHNRKRKQSHEFQLTEHLIRTRNEDVMKGLRDRYSSLPDHDSDITMFCVSNTSYWSHRHLPAPEALPMLKLSGILDIRRHCLGIVMASQLHAAKIYIHEEIPSVLSQMDLWVQSGTRQGSEERRAALRQAVVEVETILKNHLTGRRARLSQVETVLKQAFRTGIYARRQAVRWSQAAKIAASSWSGWSHPSYSAFVRNEGDYTTEKKGSHNWNAEAIESLVSDLADPWDGISEELRRLQNTIVEDIEQTLEEVRDRLGSLETRESPAVDRLETAIETRAHILSDTLDSHFEGLEANFRMIRICLLSTIPSSLIRQVMRPHYRSAASEFGRGSHRRRVDIIEGAFGDPDLFNRMIQGVKISFWREVEAVQSNILTSVAQYFVGVKEDFDLVREESVARESEHNPEFSNMVAEMLNEDWRTIEKAKSAIPR